PLRRRGAARRVAWLSLPRPPSCRTYASTLWSQSGDRSQSDSGQAGRLVRARTRGRVLDRTHAMLLGLGRCALAEARRGRLYRALAVAAGWGGQPFPCGPPELLVLGDQTGDGMAAHDVAPAELPAHVPASVPHHRRVGARAEE